MGKPTSNHKSYWMSIGRPKDVVINTISDQSDNVLITKHVIFYQEVSIVLFLFQLFCEKCPYYFISSDLPLWCCTFTGSSVRNESYRPILMKFCIRNSWLKTRNVRVYWMENILEGFCIRGQAFWELDVILTVVPWSFLSQVQSRT